MNARQRIEAALAGRPADRRPFTALLSLYGAALTGCPAEHYYTTPQAYVDGQTAALETFGVDILFTPFCLAGLGRAWGGTIRTRAGQAPYLESPAIDRPERIGELTMPDLDEDPSLTYIRRATHQLVARHGAEVAVAAPTLGPLDMPVTIMGLEGWLQTLLFDPDGTRLMLEFTRPFYDVWSACLFAEGVTCLVLPSIFLSPRILTRSVLERVALPLYRELFASSAGPVVIHHGGSPIGPFLDAWARLPETVVGFALDETDNLRQARSQVGPGRLLMGGPAGPDLSRHTPEEVFRRCTQMLEDRRGDPAFILTTTAADIPLGTPPENIHVMREAVTAFR